MEGVPETAGVAGRVAACSPAGSGWGESPDSLNPTGESDLAQSLERYHRGLRGEDEEKTGGQFRRLFEFGLLNLISFVLVFSGAAS